jgi:hypothetical protein
LCPQLPTSAKNLQISEPGAMNKYSSMPLVVNATATDAEGSYLLRMYHNSKLCSYLQIFSQEYMRISIDVIHVVW